MCIPVTSPEMNSYKHLMKGTRPFKILFMAFLGLFCASCGKEDNTGGTASLSVRLHDNPVDADSVLVEIVQVRIHVNDTGWLTLASDTGIYDLLLLQNGIDTLLVPVQQIPAGKISQIRFILGDDNRVVVDSVSYPLALSSQDESGLKLNLHADIQSGQQYTIIVDFDAEQSVMLQGNDTYRLKPVLRATIQ